MGTSPISIPRRTLTTVFLDRDGVVNQKLPEGQYVTSWDEFHLLPGVPQAIAQLNHAGLRVIVVSNQRGIALGLYSATDVQTIAENLQLVLREAGAHLDGFYFCPHDKQECDCRKPLPGLFHQAVAEFPSITGETSAMVGDSLSDIEFGRRLGMLTLFIEGDPTRQKAGANSAAELADLRVPNLAEAADFLATLSTRQLRSE